MSGNYYRKLSQENYQLVYIITEIITGNYQLVYIITPKMWELFIEILAYPKKYI